MKKYITAKNTGKGFITHDDQGRNSLKFRIVGGFVVVNGEESKISSWKTRVGGTEISKNEADIMGKNRINSLRDERISQLQTELSEEILREQNRTFDINDY